MSDHLSQERRILNLLHATWPEWVPSSRLAQISLQYGARFFSLRKRFEISNRVEIKNGVRLGFFRLGSHPIRAIASCAQVGSQRQRCRNHNRLRLRTFSITAHYLIDVSFSRASETVASRHSLLPEKNGPLFYVYRDRSADGNGRVGEIPGNGPLVDVAKHA